jgi:hypothetical protein
MAQSFQWCHSETAWLSMLVETFERLSDPEVRATPCDAGDLAAAKRHLVRQGFICGESLSPPEYSRSKSTYSPAI